MLTIYGVTRSRASRIIWLCHELGLPFRQEPVIQAYRLADPNAADAPMNTRSSAFLARAPMGAIPVIEDDGFVLSETMAITLYLAGKYGPPFGPTSAEENALMMQWAFVAATWIEPDALTLLFLHGRGRAQSGEDQALIAQAGERLIRPMQVLEAHLSRHPYLVGDRFSVADINMAEVVRFAQGYAPLMDGFPAVRAWLEDCQSRPAFVKMWQERLAEPE